MIVDFVNALFEFSNTGKFELYSGPTVEGGQTKVTLERGKADGYNMQYYNIKQVIVQPGGYPAIQKVEVSGIEAAHKLILMAIEEKQNGRTELRSIDTTVTDGSGELETINEHDNSPAPIPVVYAKSKPINKIISTTPITATGNEQPHSPTNFGNESHDSIDSELESFMGAGIKIANMRVSNTNVKASAEHRDSISNLLDSPM